MIDRRLRELVATRAEERCEYCHFEQHHAEVTFQIDHIIARSHGGDDEPKNLALACDRCNAHKGTNLSGFDPATRQKVDLFNPREHVWDEHFFWEPPHLRGRTAIGRATVSVLDINAAIRLEIRLGLMAVGEFEP